MHLPTIRARQDRERAYDASLARTPRDTAVEWLTQRVADGRLALDPFDPSLAVLDVGPNERTWAYRCLELCGFVEARYDQPEGRQRIVACLESDVRKTLGLDKPGAPVAADVPLASRGLVLVTDQETHLRLVDAPEAIMDAVFGVLPGEPESAQSIRDAKTAYEQRHGTVETVCPTCRGTGGGQYNDCPTCDGNGAVA